LERKDEGKWRLANRGRRKRYVNGEDCRKRQVV